MSKPSFLARAGAAVVATAVLLVAAAAPVHAGTEERRDPGKDVLSGEYLSDDLPSRPEPARRLGDITTSSASYDTDLVVSTTFRNLAATGHQEFSWFILTSEDEFSWSASLVVRPGRDKGRFTLLDPIAYQPGCGKAVVDRAARRVTLTIPASCLGDPRWVKVGNGVTVYVGDRKYADDAHTDGTILRRGWKYGSKLRQGQ